MTERAARFVESAYQYAGLGWATVRCEGKAAKGTGWQTTQPDTPETAAGKWSHWGERWNLGVVCGPSGVAVLDVDHDDADAAALGLLGLVELPETPIVRTGRGRLQLYFRDPGGLEKKTRNGFELRVGPHQCVAPPSTHPDTGRDYEWLPEHAPWEVEPLEIPARVLAYFAASSNGRQAFAADETIRIGAIDTTLTSKAGTMRRAGMNEDEIHAALVTMLERCEPGHTHTEKDCRRIARSVSRYQPAERVERGGAGQVAAGGLPGSVAHIPFTLDEDAFRLEPVDWQALAAAGPPQFEYLLAPFLPKRKRVWAVGAGESGKSIWAAAKAAELSRADELVIYISQENGLEEEARRFLRLQPSFTHLRLYVDQGLDLVNDDHRAALLAISEGAALVVLDTFTACWSGDEDSNDELAAFDREIMKPLQITGTSVLVLDHTGNPQPNVRRRGVSAPRGASSKGQKTDFLLEFRATGDGSFRVERGKKRGTSGKEPRSYNVVDADDGTLELIESDPIDDRDLVGELAELLEDGEWRTANKLRARKDKGGVGADLDAIKEALADARFERTEGPAIGQRKGSTYYRLREAPTNTADAS